MATHTPSRSSPSKPDNPISELHAAMMEELGAGRKDRLPLEGGRGRADHVNLEALDRGRRANDPRTVEHKLFQKNENYISAWNNVKFEDVDEADLALDEMNLGQSHRLRLKAELDKSRRENTTFTRGGHAQRGGRKESSARGRPNSSRMLGPLESRPSFNETIARLKGTPNTCSQKKVPSSAPANGGRGHSMTQVSQPKANLSYLDSRSVYALPIAASNHNTSEATEDELLGPRVPQPGQSTQNFPALVSPEEFIARNWGAALKVVQDDGKEAKPPMLQPDQYLSFNPTAETKRINREILQQAAAKVEVTSQNQESISLDQTNAQIVRITCSEQDLLVIEAGTDGKPTLQCYVDSIIDLMGDSCSLNFESVDAEMRKKWRLTFQLPWIAVQFREKLLQYFPKLKYVGDVGTLISFSDEPEAPTEACSKFTEDLMSLMDDDAVDQILDAINRDASKPLLAQVTEIIGSVQSENPISSTSESSQQLISLDFLGEQNTTSVNSLENSLSLLKSYGGLGSSIYATATEEVVRDFQSKSTVFNSLPEDVSRAYTRKLSRKLLHRAQGLANTTPQSPSSTGMANGSPNKIASTRITYTIEELKRHRLRAFVIKKNLLQEWIPTWVPPGHHSKPAESQNISPSKTKSVVQATTNTTLVGNNIGARVEAKKPRGLADSMYADKKQTVSFAPADRNSNTWERVSLLPISTTNSKHGITVTSIDKSSSSFTAVSSPQDAVRVKQAAPASTEKSYHLKNGLLSSRYATTPTLSSSPSKALDTKNPTGKALSAASIPNGSPAPEAVGSKLPPNYTLRSKSFLGTESPRVQTITSKLVHPIPSTPHETKAKAPLNTVSTLENLPVIAASSKSNRAKPKSPLNPICQDFLPLSKDSPSQKATAASNSSFLLAYPGLHIATNNSSVAATPVHVSPRYETVLLPDPLQPGYYQEVRGILKINNQLQFPPSDPNLGPHQPMVLPSPVLASSPLAAVVELPVPPKPVSRI